jgi:MFS family permease
MLATLLEHMVRLPISIPITFNNLTPTHFRGLTNSFSIFETRYQHTFSHLGHSTISWIGSLQLFLTLFIGVFAGRYLDTGLIRPVVVIGIAFEVSGMLMTSFCREFWHLVLAQGIVVGIGCGNAGIYKCGGDSVLLYKEADACGWVREYGE